MHVIMGTEGGGELWLFSGLLAAGRAKGAWYPQKKTKKQALQTDDKLVGNRFTASATEWIHL